MIRRMLERRQALRTLSRLDLFRDCPPAELKAVDSLLTEVQVPAGRTLMQEGDHGFEFVVIAEGRAAIVHEGHQLAEVGPGSFVGELSLLDDAPRSATVVALGPMRVYALNPSEFMRLLDLAPTVRDRILAAADERHRELATAA